MAEEVKAESNAVDGEDLNQEAAEQLLTDLQAALESGPPSASAGTKRAREPVKLGYKTFTEGKQCTDYLRSLMANYAKGVDFNEVRCACAAAHAFLVANPRSRSERKPARALPSVPSQYEYLVLLDLLKQGHPEGQKKARHFPLQRATAAPAVIPDAHNAWLLPRSSSRSPAAAAATTAAARRRLGAACAASRCAPTRARTRTRAPSSPCARTAPPRTSATSSAAPRCSPERCTPSPPRMAARSAGGAAGGGAEEAGGAAEAEAGGAAEAACGRAEGAGGVAGRKQRRCV